MNNIIIKNVRNTVKGFAVFLFVGMAFASCSEETFEGADEAGLPVAEDAKVNVTVDQTINQVTFNMDCYKNYPLWILPQDANSVDNVPGIPNVISGTVYSTLNGYQKIYNKAGDFVVNYKVGNRNGISQGMGSATFHIDNAIVDFSAFMNILSGKNWQIAHELDGHIAYGPTGTDGTGTYSASADEYSSDGIYDDVITFSKDSTTGDFIYTYDPGAGGTMLVNSACSLWPNSQQTTNFMVPVDKQSVAFTMSTEGNDVSMTMPANTLFPYIPTNDAYTTPKFRLESLHLNPDEMVLIYDNGSVAWHYILENYPTEDVFPGYDSESDCNMFKTATINHTFYYATTNNWVQQPNPSYTDANGVYTVTLPLATVQQWQAQCNLETDIATNSSTNYDFSANIMSTTDIPNATVKLVSMTDDNVYYFQDGISLKAGVPYVYFKDNMLGLDIDNVKLVLDFGGAPDNTTVTVSGIDLQEHMCDGVQAPDVTSYIYDSPTNIWKADVDDTGDYTMSYYYAPGWAQIADPGFAANAGTYTITLPTATTDQWQAQVQMTTNVPATAGTRYDFSCKLLSTTDIAGVTVKLTDLNDDTNFLFTPQVNLQAGVEYTLKIPKVTLAKDVDASQLQLVLDFGGNPDNTQVQVSNIILQKTAE